LHRSIRALEAGLGRPCSIAQLTKQAQRAFDQSVQQHG